MLACVYAQREAFEHDLVGARGVGKCHIVKCHISTRWPHGNMTSLVIDGRRAIQNFKNLLCCTSSLCYFRKSRHNVAQPDDERDREAVENHEIANALLKLGRVIFNLMTSAPLRKGQRSVKSPRTKEKVPPWTQDNITPNLFDIHVATSYNSFARSCVENEDTVRMPETCSTAIPPCRECGRANAHG